MNPLGGPKASTTESTGTQAATYQNPFHLQEEWPDYGIGDPFVMRYNGRYYLYCSTKDGRVGVKTWSSPDLVHWQYEGLASEDPVTVGAYAPEVVYWNGYFYMYTSPAGKGHYVLRSDKPTGPFTVQTENLGLSIDGDVFIDDDGKWVFTHAGSSGIVGHTMASPTEIDPDGKTLNAFMGHWTEGSMIIKRNGTYFLTYTGNHVFSKGYRINYAVAEDSPLGEYRVPDNNPILISTKPEFNGLGHSSTVLGPDLDSYYLVYHNLAGRSSEGPPVRYMNIDRLVFNGQKMAVSGPTQQAQPAPSLPAFAHNPSAGSDGSSLWEKPSSGDRSVWTSKISAESRFTAEYNFVAHPQGQGDEGDFRLLYSYRGPDDYGYIQIDAAAKKMTLHRLAGGQDKELASADLPREMDFGKLHTVRLEAAAPGITVLFDGMAKINIKDALAAPGKIGYAFTGGQPDIQATSFSNEAAGSSDAEAAKTVPGSIEAVHYMRQEGRGFHVAHPDHGAAYRPEDGVPVEREETGSFAVKLSGRGDWLAYKLNAAGAENINVDAVLKREGPVELEVKIGEETRRVELNGNQEAGRQGGDWVKTTIASLPVKPGIQTMRIKLLKGEVELRSFDFYEAERKPDPLPDAFKQVSSDDLYGPWELGPDGYTVQKQGQDAKMFVGRDSWTDYQIDLDLKSTQDDPLYEGSLLFRVTNESDFPEQVKDSFMGYELVFRSGRIILRKVNYEQSEELTSAVWDAPVHKDVQLRVSAKGSRLSVSAVTAGKGDQPLLQWDDPDAFLHGKVGIRSSDPTWTFTRLAVTFP